MAQAEVRPRQKRGNTVTLLGIIAAVALVIMFSTGALKLPATLNQTDDMSVAGMGAVNAVQREQWEPSGQAEDDPIAELWAPERFSTARSLDSASTCWYRANYGLLHLDRRDGRTYLELSPNGNSTSWESFGQLTLQSVQVVGTPGSPSIQDFLKGGRSCWGTLAVNLSGRNPDDAQVSAATFIPYGEPERIALVPIE